MFLDDFDFRNCLTGLYLACKALVPGESAIEFLIEIAETKQSNSKSSLRADFDIADLLSVCGFRVLGPAAQ